MPATFHVGDTRDVVASLPTGSVDLILTSPPFLALRSYLPADHPDKAREIGSESDPAAFIDVMLGLTAEWRRVLAPHGSLAVELGDTYSGSGGAGGDYAEGGLRDGQAKFSGSARATRRQPPNTAHRLNDDGSLKTSAERRKTEPKALTQDLPMNGGHGWPLAKCMTLVPELYRVGLAYGRNPLTGAESPAGRWRVRNVVRWVRPNPPVGALGDKFRPATSDMVIACTASDRYFDLHATLQPLAAKTLTVRDGLPASAKNQASPTASHGMDRLNNHAGAPPLDWWQISTSGYAGAHYATFPTELCVKPIEAMCPRRVCRTCGKPSRREVERTNATGVGTTRSRQPGHERAVISTDAPDCAETVTTGWTSCGCPGTDGIRLDGFHTGTGWRPGVVLDPFGGTGTTGMVATGHGRDAILIDLDARNADLARERLGMFLDVA